ncbi:hypothetical protein GSI_09280 [Ganoderma sinense ZZ0214-1]|uniref:Uncharacterized protein n=1 Tax=Ganoderma sinense ZZ0214-1 TaxID=1077348 RepID=A0A2G8S642_9APHY|nr:hypothetical protein GSI_09280 [Ganoderma sinense ZZ0214-1]
MRGRRMFVLVLPAPCISMCVVFVSRCLYLFSGRTTPAHYSVQIVAFDCGICVGLTNHPHSVYWFVALQLVYTSIYLVDPLVYCYIQDERPRRVMVLGRDQATADV